MPVTLTIAVSTTGGRINSVLNWNFDPGVTYLLLWQDPKADIAIPSLPENVNLIKLDSHGVAFSRNTAISMCKTEWLWFMDDDVVIPESSIRNILRKLEVAHNNEIYICTLSDPNGKKIKSHQSGYGYSVRDILSVGTVQIICNAGMVKENGIFFPRNLGAGSKYPVCDEPVFLNRMLNKCGVRIYHIDDVVVEHPENRSGRILNSRNHLKARAIAFYEIFGFPLSVAASIYFFFAHIKEIKWSFVYLFMYEKAD